MPISIQCDCGKTLKVDEKHLGKRAKCPACGSRVLIEEAADKEAASAVQAEPPRKRKAVPKDDDEDDDGDSEVRKPAKRKKQVVQRSITPWILGGCGLLTVLACCLAGVGGSAWYFYFRSTDSDLIYVHDGVAGFVSVRVSDVWKNPDFKENFNKNLGPFKDGIEKKIAEAETKLGLKLDDLERATVIVRSTDLFGRNDSGIWAVVLRTSKPMDRKKVIDYLAKEMNYKEKEAKHEGNTLHVMQGFGDPVVLFFPTDKMVLIAPSEAGMKDLLNKSKNPPKNAVIARGVQMASSVHNTFVAAFEIKKDMTKNVPEDIKKQAPNLTEANGVIIAGSQAKDKTSELIVTFPNQDAAAKGKTDLQTLITLGRAMVKDQIRNPQPALITALDSINAEQRGEEVFVKIKNDLDLKGLQELPGLAFGAGGAVGRAAERTQGINNLKQIVLAIHSFHDDKKSLPNHAIRHPKTGQPLLSWRVTILPYIGEKQLYDQFHLDERWDSPHNRQFVNKMPKVYQLPGKFDDSRTYYQVFHGNESAFPKSMFSAQKTLVNNVTMVAIQDGTSNTIFVAEAAMPVNWTQPDDIPFQMNDQGLINRVGNLRGDNTFLVAMGDGTVRIFPRTMPSQNLQAFITRAGNEPVVFP